MALDTPEFGRRFNLPHQLAYQAQTRRWAQATDRHIIMPGPFENLYCEVDDPAHKGSKLSLLEKMRRHDFEGFQLISIQIVLTPKSHEADTVTLTDLEDHAWLEEVTREFTRRLRKRIADRTTEDPFLGTVQQLLDESKLDDVRAYARTRLTHLVTSHQLLGTPLVVYRQGEQPEEAAARILEYI